MRHALTALSLCLTPLLFQVAVPPRAAAAELETYQRKYISFFQAQETPFNGMLLRGLKQELPRFDYHVLTTSGGGGLSEFLQEVRRYQKENAGELANRQETETLRFGDRVVTWSDTRRIMDSAFVFAPNWSWTPIELTGPHPISSAGGQTWVLRAESNLQLQLDIYKASGGDVGSQSNINQAWRVRKEIPINDMDQLLTVVKQVTGVDIDINNPVQQSLVLDVIKKIPTFQQLLQEDPAVYLGEEGLRALANGSYAALANELKQQPAFALKGGIENVSMKDDQLTINLGQPSADLGVGLDDGYKILESRQSGGREETVEVGYAKVRKLDSGILQLQPIIVGRDYEIGDQVKEYSKLGLNMSLNLGTSPIWLNSPSQQFGAFDVANLFKPSAELQIEYSLAKLIGLSETFLTLHGGASLPVTQSFLDLQQPSQIPGIQVNPLSEALGITGELGLAKRWYIRQWIISAGVSGGALLGLLMNTQNPQVFDLPMTTSFGGTLRLGVQYQITPDFIMGFNTGFRYFGDGYWSTSAGGFPQPIALPPLSSWGPLLHLYTSLNF
ncbi:MAG: hypothetical protein ACO1RX_11800 [Candidatus Sericytochromatia bacterium]